MRNILSSELETRVDDGKRARESECYLKPSINSIGRARKIPLDFSDPLPIGFVSRRAPIPMGEDMCRAFPAEGERGRG